MDIPSQVNLKDGKLHAVVDTAATCKDEGSGYLTFYYAGQQYVSNNPNDDVDDVVLTYEKTDKHNYVETYPVWVDKDGNPASAPKCGETGYTTRTKKCSVCGKDDPDYIAKTITETTREHSLDGVSIVAYTNCENVVFNDGGSWEDIKGNDDSTEKHNHIGGTPTLSDTDENGTYTVTTYQTCTECGEKVVTKKADTVKLYAKKATYKAIVWTMSDSNIDDIIGFGDGKVLEVNAELPSDSDVKLKDCSKSGYYEVRYLDKNGKTIATDAAGHIIVSEHVTGQTTTNSIKHTVAAHHYFTQFKIEPVNSADAGLVSFQYTISDAKLILQLMELL